MTGKDLPDEDHVIRYAKPTDILDDGKLNCSAFQLRPIEAGLSVNWLEHFGSQTKSQQLDEIRSLIRLIMKPRGRLAELNVGVTRKHIGHSLDGLRFVHTPLAADNGFPADPSHSEIVVLPPKSSPESELIGDMIAECVNTTHPAVVG